MARNKEKIHLQYSLGKEDARAGLDRSSGLEFYYTKQHREGFIQPEDNLLEVGCATGNYGFYYADKCNTYCG